MDRYMPFHWLYKENRPMPELPDTQPRKAEDPVHFENGKWYFYDETWASRIGPFETEAGCRAALEHYAERL